MDGVNKSNIKLQEQLVSIVVISASEQSAKEHSVPKTAVSGVDAVSSTTNIKLQVQLTSTATTVIASDKQNVKELRT